MLGSREEKTPLLSSQIVQGQSDTINDNTDIEYDDSDNCTNISLQTSKNNILGMLCVTVSAFLLMTCYASAKYTSNILNVSLFECIIVTNFIQNCIAWTLWFLPSSITQKQEYIKLWYSEKEYRYSVWFRGFFYWCDLYLYWYGITLVPIGDAETIYFLSPIFVAFGARIFLKETFSKTFPFVVTITITGLCILCQPHWLIHLVNIIIYSSDYEIYSTESINIKGVILLIIGCMFWAGMSLMVRLSQKAHWIQLEIVSTLQAFAIWTPLLLFINYLLQLQSDHNINLDTTDATFMWHFSPEIVAFLILIALLTSCGLMFMVLGYQFGEATKVSWMEYTNVCFAFLYQWIIFDDAPNMYETIGVAMVLTACLIGVGEEYYNYKINSINESNIQQDGC